MDSFAFHKRMWQNWYLQQERDTHSAGSSPTERFLLLCGCSWINLGVSIALATTCRKNLFLFFLIRWVNSSLTKSSKLLLRFLLVTVCFLMLRSQKWSFKPLACDSSVFLSLQESQTAGVYHSERELPVAKENRHQKYGRRTPHAHWASPVCLLFENFNLSSLHLF